MVSVGGPGTPEGRVVSGTQIGALMSVLNRSKAASQDADKANASRSNDSCPTGRPT